MIELPWEKAVNATPARLHTSLNHVRPIPTPTLNIQMKMQDVDYIKATFATEHTGFHHKFHVEVEMDEGIHVFMGIYATGDEIPFDPPTNESGDNAFPNICLRTTIFKQPRFAGNRINFDAFIQAKDKKERQQFILSPTKNLQSTLRFYQSNEIQPLLQLV